MLFAPWSWQLWHSLWPPSLTTWQLFQCDTSINSFSPHLTQQPLVLTLLSAQWLGEHKYEFYVNDVWPLQTVRTITHWVTNVMCWQLLTAAWLLCSLLSGWCLSLCLCSPIPDPTCLSLVNIIKGYQPLPWSSPLPALSWYHIQYKIYRSPPTWHLVSLSFFDPKHHCFVFNVCISISDGTVFDDCHRTFASVIALEGLIAKCSSQGVNPIWQGCFPNIVVHTPNLPVLNVMVHRDTGHMAADVESWPWHWKSPAQVNHNIPTETQCCDFKRTKRVLLAINKMEQHHSSKTC